MIWFLVVAVVAGLLVLRRSRAPRLPPPAFVALIERSREAAVELERERHRVASLTGPEREEGLRGIERADTARRAAVAKVDRWREQLERQGYDVRGFTVPTPEEAEDAVLLAEAELEVERLVR